MSSRIEQIIEEIEEYINSCKYQHFSNTMIVVDKEEIDELLRELRMKTPDEIKRYQKIISNKEAILDDAKQRAEALINEAQIHTNNLINEHEIMQQAYAQANEVVQQATAQAQGILDKATQDANDIRMGAMQYTDDSLANLQSILGHAMESSQSRYENLLASLEGCMQIVNANRAELHPEEELENDVAIAEKAEAARHQEGFDEINLDMLNG